MTAVEEGVLAQIGLPYPRGCRLVAMLVKRRWASMILSDVFWVVDAEKKS
jgi:hypothetical protein